MANDIDATIAKLHDAGATDEEITGIIKEKFGYKAPAGHGTASMLGHPTQPYPEGGTPQDPRSLPMNRIAAGLEHAAYPQSQDDIARLLLAPTDATRSAMAYAPSAMRQVGEAGRAVGNLISRTHLNPSALLDFKINQPFQMLGKLISVDAAQTANPLATMGRGPSVPGGSGPTTASGPPEPFGAVPPRANPLSTMGQGPDVAAARVSGRIIPNGGPPETFGVGRQPTANPLESMGRGPSTEAAGSTGPVGASGQSEPFGIPRRPMNPLENMGQGPSTAAASRPGPVVAGGKPEPFGIANALKTEARRRGMALSQEEYDGVTTLVNEGASPADAIEALARIRKR